MQRSPWLALALALLAVAIAGCSADPMALMRPGQSGAVAGRSQGSAGTGTASEAAGKASNPTGGVNDLENPNGLLPPASAVAGSGGATAGAGGAVASGDCEPGKFCAPTSPDPTDCGTLTLKQDVEVKRDPGNLLLVFDQSGSMGEFWQGGQTKMAAAQGAIVNAIMSLQNDLTVGAIFFPSYACVPVFPPPPGGAVAAIEAPEQIAFQPGPQFLQSWQQHWTMPSIGLGIGTPMQEAFDRADIAIQNAKLTGALAVVAVTDGAPNCFPDPMITMIPTAVETQRAASWLADKQIKTYVVGLPGAQGVQLLNDVANSGGTAQYILPDDPKMLEEKLKEVVKETVRSKFDSCSVKLTPAADPPDKLKMVVVEAATGMESMVPHMLSPTASWTISNDGMQVEIMGQLCDDAKAGRFSSITFEYGCKSLPPLPPPPPLN